MRIIGVDPSLTATGVATPEQVATLHPPNGIKGPARLVWFRERISYIASYAYYPDTAVDLARADLIVREGYSYASPYQAHQLGELGGVIEVALFEMGIPLLVIPPDVIKKYATGNGGAGKDEMLSAAIRRLGYDGHDHNQADALWLREAALYHYQVPGLDCAIPKAQREALYATVRKGKRKGQPVIEWPALAETVATGERL